MGASIYWVGERPIPEWLSAVGSVERCRSQDLTDDTLLALIPGDLGEQLADAVRQARARAGRAQVVALTSASSAEDEVALLQAGATMILSPADPLTPARLGALSRPLQGRQGVVEQRRKAALQMASELLHTMADTDTIFQRLVEVISTELNSTRVSILQVNRDEGVLEFRAALGVPPDVVRTARPPIGKGIAGRCAELGVPLFISDHRAVKAKTDLEDFQPPDLDLSDLPMSVTVPILVRDEVVGVVNITDKQDQLPYDKGDIQFVSALMSHTAYLLENAALVANLKRLRSFSESMLNSIGDPIAVVDGDDHHLIGANSQFGKVFGSWTESTLWGCLGLDPEAEAPIREALNAGQGELHGVSVGPRIYDLEVRDFASSYHARRLIVLRDMTDRRQMEKRLVSAEKLASLGVLAAGVAHEINNPISFVKANARQMGTFFDDVLSLLDAYRAAAPEADDRFAAAKAEEEALDLEDLREEIVEMVGETVEGVERVEKIVSGLKGFAHPDTEKVRAADPQKLVQHAVLLTTGKWKYDLEIEISAAENIPQIQCVPNQLEQVFMNLIVNAAQAANGFQRLDIRLLADEAHVMVRFEDTCGGIPKHIAERIFEPFFTTKDIGEGTGLGLSISHNIIAGHGGELRLETDREGGTTFVVQLPLDAAPVVAQQHSTYRV